MDLGPAGRTLRVTGASNGIGISYVAGFTGEGCRCASCHLWPLKAFGYNILTPA